MRFSKKIIRCLPLILYVLLSSLAVAITLEQKLTFLQEFPIFSVSTEGKSGVVDDRIKRDGELRLSRLNSLGWGPLDDFTIKAHIAFKSDQQIKVENGVHFGLQVPSSPSLPSGWGYKKSLFSWNEEAQKSAQPLRIKLPLIEGAKPIQLSELVKFRVDYSELPGVPACVATINLLSSPDPLKTGDPKALNYKIIEFNEPKVFKPQINIDFQSSIWRPRDYSYFIRRMLNLAPDDDWRYSQNQQNSIIQRRMHVPLNGIDVLDVEVSDNIFFEQINLKVSQEDNPGQGELITFDNLQYIKLPNGNRGIRLNLTKALKKRFVNERIQSINKSLKSDFFLQEIFFFISGEVGAISNARPVKSFTFSKAVFNRALTENIATTNAADSFDSYVEVNGSYKSIVFNLNKLKKSDELILAGGELVLHPPVGEKNCAVDVRGVYVSNTYSSSVPKFARILEDLSRRWGGPFNELSLQRDKVESPGIIRYLPLSVLDQDAQNGMKSIDFLKPKVSQKLSPQSDLIQSINISGLHVREGVRNKVRLISSGGASLSIEGAMPTVGVENDLLVLGGHSEMLEISWRLMTNVSDKTLLYFGVVEGAEEIGPIELIIDLADGSLARRTIIPNKPIRLGVGSAKVQNIRLRAPLLINATNRIKLRDLVLFAPTSVTYAEAFAIALPMPSKVLPKLEVESGAMLFSEPGHIAGSLSNKPLRFSTSLDPSLNWVSGMNVKFSLSPTLSVKECRLLIQFNWMNGITMHQVRLESPSGPLYIPVGSFVGASNKHQAMGALKSIDWLLDSTCGGQEGDLFDMQFSVDGWAMISTADKLRFSPIFNLNGRPFFADVGQGILFDSGRYQQEVWVPLNSQSVPKILATHGRIEPVKHSLFALNELVVQPKQQMSWSSWNNLTKLTDLSTPSSWLKWLTCLGVILLVLVGLKKGWWLLIRSWAQEKFKVEDLMRVTHHKFIWLELKLRFKYRGVALLVIWITLAILLYGSGLLVKVVDGENYFFALGAIAALFSLRTGLFLVEIRLRRFSPSMAEHIYVGAGNLDFVGALIMLVMTATMVIFKLQPIAEQFAIVAYYCLVIGTFQVIWRLCRSDGEN